MVNHCHIEFLLFFNDLVLISTIQIKCKHFFLCYNLESHTVTEEHLDLLRKNIGANWKHCARALGLTKFEIETIAHDYYLDGLPEMVYQMLDKWKMKEGSIGCTVGKLYRALLGKIKVDVIQKILESCGSTQ